MEFNLKNPIYNAAGCKCATKEDLDGLESSGSGAILTKSCTFEKRAGNPHPKYWDNGYTSLNSNGLENEGYEFYLNYYDNYIKKYELETNNHNHNHNHNHNQNYNRKPFILSVAGLTLDDNVEIIKSAIRYKVDAIELNLSCPNIGGVPVSQDIPTFKNYLESIYFGTRYIDHNIPIGLKLPIYTNKGHIKQVSNLIKEYSISFISCSNSMPNCIQFDIEEKNEKYDIKPFIKNVSGGAGGGDFMRNIVLGQIYQFREFLPNRKDTKIIMCGGIRNGMDCYLGKKVGADYFQVGTQYMVEGPSCFNRIFREYQDINQ